MTLVKIIIFLIYVTSLLRLSLVICITQGKMKLGWQVLVITQTKNSTPRLQILPEAEHPNGTISVVKCDKINMGEFLLVRYKHQIALFFWGGGGWSYRLECSIQRNTDIPCFRGLLFLEMLVWKMLEHIIVGWQGFIIALNVV
jgi:hypothetical protein